VEDLLWPEDCRLSERGQNVEYSAHALTDAIGLIGEKRTRVDLPKCRSF
jgi:hypothetical protein